jgi:hypothetical protein
MATEEGAKSGDFSSYGELFITMRRVFASFFWEKNGELSQLGREKARPYPRNVTWSGGRRQSA